MTDLYRRILLWHKLLAMQTGGLALCSARHKLNRDEAKGWSGAARNVADDIDAFLHDGTFVLDDKGQRVVHSGTEGTTGPLAQEDRHEVGSKEGSDPKGRIGSEAASPTRKAGGLRVATRRKQ